jgi:hypothetical protein
MTIQLDFYQTLTIVFVVIGALFTIAKLITSTILAKFEKGENDDKEVNKEIARIDRDFLLLKAELPIVYQRREDALQQQSRLEAKIDGLVNLLAEAHVIDRRIKPRGDQ